MKFAICNETFQGWAWEPTCRAIAAAGYDGVEIAPFTLAEDIRSLDASARRTIRETAERAGLEIVGLHWLLASPPGLSVTASDDAVRRATSDYLVALADFCHDLGGHVMVFGSPNQRRVQEGEDRETALERLISTLRPGLDRAQSCDVSVCLEPLPASESDLLWTLEEAAALMRRFDHPAARTIFDVKSASAEGRPLPNLIADYAPLFAHVHANDANRRGPGFGDTDFRPILAALQKADYRGWVSVEVFDYTPDPETIAVESLSYLLDCLGKRAQHSH